MLSNADRFTLRVMIKQQGERIEMTDRRVDALRAALDTDSTAREVRQAVPATEAPTLAPEHRAALARWVKGADVAQRRGNLRMSERGLSAYHAAKAVLELFPPTREPGWYWTTVNAARHFGRPRARKWTGQIWEGVSVNYTDDEITAHDRLPDPPA